MTQASQIPKVPVPDDIAPAVTKAVMDWTNPLMFTLSEHLQDLGLDAPHAVQIEINALMTWACRIGYMSARIIERREPCAGLWAQACADEFQKTAVWFAETHKDAPPIERTAGLVETLDDMPFVGDIWAHTASGRRYKIVGHTQNTVTDKTDIRYRPLYECEHAEFSRQLIGHPKAFVSINESGERRFTRIGSQI